ncbi:MAG: carboxypeptidase-like regulatory domain-containing protein, partial [Mangrovibacterium sp.]
IRYDVVASGSDTPFLRPLLDGKNGDRIPEGIPDNDSNFPRMWLLTIIYFSGLSFFLLRLLIQTIQIMLTIRRSVTSRTTDCYIHENTTFSMPFSFFNHIFIHSEIHRQCGLSAILAHEKVHIRERRWIDLLFIELLTVLFWFNPFIWFFEHAMKQNHEFLADEGVLSLGHSPVRYQALLVNQLMGMQVIGLTNHLSFAHGPNRLKMINKQKTSKRKLFRIFWAVPLLGILLTAFAEPEYQTNQAGKQPATDLLTAGPDLNRMIAGRVVNESDNPVSGAHIVIRGTTTGTVTDEQGNFSLEFPDLRHNEIVISYVGLRTIVAQVTPGKGRSWNFKMEREIIGIDTKSMFLEKEMPSPPPPPAPQAVPPGKPEKFLYVEEMPFYPGGHRGLGQYVKKHQTELKAKNPNLQGKATVDFTIDTSGKVTNIRVVNTTTPEAAEAMITILKGMESWTPGKQRDQAVPVDFEMQLEF